MLMRWKKYLFFYFILCGIFPFPAQSTRQSDSLLKLIPSANDTNRIILYMQLGDMYGSADLKRGLQYYHSAVEEARKSRNGRWILKTHLKIFYALKNSGNTKRAYNIIDSAMIYLDTLNPNPDYGSYLISRGNISFSEANYNNAALYYLHSLKIFDELNDDVGRARAYHGLGYAHNGMEDYDRAIEYYKKSVNLYKKNGLFQNVARIQGNIGGIYVNWYEHSKSEKDFRMAFDILTEAVESGIKAKDMELTGNNYNNLATLFAFAEKYKEAIAYNEKALEIREKNDLKYGI